MNRNNGNMDNQTFLWAALLLIVLFGVPAVYAAKAGYINGVLISLSLMQLKLFLPFSDEVQTACAHIVRLDPAALSWEQMEAVLRYTGKWIRWPFAILLVLIGIPAVLMGRTGRLVRRFNMESLLRNNAESFACLKPVLGRGNSLLSPDSYDSGLWRVARTPLQFALEHELLLDPHGNPFLPKQALKNGVASEESEVWGDARLDEAKTLIVLQKQLGPVFTGFEGLSPCRQAAAAAFIAYADGDKKECIAVLDAVSRSYTEDKNVASCPVLAEAAFAERLKAAWEKHQGILEEKVLTSHMAFELPWFMALLTRARKKGVLAGSQFLWIRPLDRSLWYALNQCGGRAAWAEAFAPWVHYMAEEKAGRTLSEPHLTHAVASLRNALDAQGWLVDIPLGTAPDKTAEAGAAPTPETDIHDVLIEPVPHPDLVYAAAEDDPEYDVYDDPELQQQQL